jgi:hypothetical protein
VRFTKSAAILRHDWVSCLQSVLVVWIVIELFFSQSSPSDRIVVVDVDGRSGIQLFAWGCWVNSSFYAREADA